MLTLDIRSEVSEMLQLGNIAKIDHNAQVKLCHTEKDILNETQEVLQSMSIKWVKN